MIMNNMQHFSTEVEIKYIDDIKSMFDIEDFMDYMRNENVSYIYQYLYSCINDTIFDGCEWNEDTAFSFKWNVEDEIERLLYLSFCVKSMDK